MRRFRNICVDDKSFWLTSCCQSCIDDAQDDWYIDVPLQTEVNEDLILEHCCLHEEKAEIMAKALRHRAKKLTEGRGK